MPQIPSVRPTAAVRPQTGTKRDADLKERSTPALERILADSRDNARSFVENWIAPGGGE